jgi:hypothetical protein
MVMQYRASRSKAQRITDDDAVGEAKVDVQARENGPDDCHEQDVDGPARQNFR